MSKIPQEAIEAITWFDLDTAPKDGTIVKLKVLPGSSDDDGWTPFEDSLEPYETIGFNQLYDTTVDRWHFAGWDWQYECFTEGFGQVLAWAPFNSTADAARAQGWLYDNEDTGREFSQDHPVESGEVPDATNIVPANAENLKAELLSTWKLQAEIVQDHDRLREEVYAAARAQEAEAEPAAWLIEHSTNSNEGKDLSFFDITDADKKYGFTSKPLYKRSPALQPTEREKMLEELLQAIIDWAGLAIKNADEFDSHGVRNLDGPVFDAARAALAGGEAPSQTDRAERGE